MKTIVLLLAAFMALPFYTLAQDNNQTKDNQFAISVQIRPRAEYRNGSLSPRAAGQEAAAFINNRARISMEYGREKLSMKLSAQHVGVWGQDPQIDKNGRFILNEAWAKLDFGDYFFAQLGRQTLSYDDERILGGLDWNVAGRYHDALKLGFDNKVNQLHLVLAFNQNDEKPIGGTYYARGAQPYKSMQSLWYHVTPTNRFNASLLFLNLGLEGAPETSAAGTHFLQTTGTYLTFTPGNWTLNGTFYYQFGRNQKDREVSAFMWALRAACKLNSKWGIVLGSDYLSGNDPDDPNGKFNAFDPLYGTHHKFYGGMDYFYASNFLPGFAPGLWDNQVGFTFQPEKRVNLSLNYHYFSTTTSVYDEREELSRGLGSEIDFQVDWTIMKDVKLSAGYSIMFGTNTMKMVKGGNPSHWQDWGWLSLNINPRVLFVKW